MNRPLSAPRGAAESAETSRPRYVVGIDLGTTNSAVAYVDSEVADWTVQTLLVPQIVAPGTIQSLETLPSFHYEAAASEFAAGALKLPWSSNSPNTVVGQFARDQGALVPGRLVSSAKSWLCHHGVDRAADLLPWQALPDVTRISPIEASARYLAHIKAAWEDLFPGAPLADQEVVLTLPASFDEIAREMTVRAAARAGLPRLMLIEEPQAAFYAWIHKAGPQWDQEIHPGQTVLVCDIGGGTTDLTLIRARPGSQGRVQFQRVAVGEHLILGGDNLDLALAHRIEQKLVPGGKLDPLAWSMLVRQSRHLKETLLGDAAPESITVTLPGKGSRLIGGGLRCELQRADVEAWLVDGFLPFTEPDAVPERRRSGFHEFGLPYAPDAAISRYLAAFLTTHRGLIDDLSRQEQDDQTSPASGAVTPGDVTAAVGNATSKSMPLSPTAARMVCPDAILFNGGFFASQVLRQRLIDLLRRWFNPQSDPRGWQPHLLENDRLDLAVARGAAYYGMVRRGQGVAITAGLPRTYYIGIERSRDKRAQDAGPSTKEKLATGTSAVEMSATEMSATEMSATEMSVEERSGEAANAGGGHVRHALCLVPAGTEPGKKIGLPPRRYELRIGQPVEFPLYVSSTRLTDAPGEILAVDEEQMTELPAIRTVLQTRGSGDRGVVQVQVEVRLTELGTLDLWVAELGTLRRWKLQFDVRSAVQTDMAAHTGSGERAGFIDEAVVEKAQQIIRDCFSGPAGGQTEATVIGPEKLVQRLAEEIGLHRDAWPAPLLRRLWEPLLEQADGRRRSPAHEARWLNMTGFALRPGYGIAADDWRVAETRKLLSAGFCFPGPQVMSEWWVFLRRISGGLNAGQQQSLAGPVIAQLKQSVRQARTTAGSKAAAGKGKPTGSASRVNWQEQAETIRWLGSCELLSLNAKEELATVLREMLRSPIFEKQSASCLWALGRLASRVPLYGPLNGVLPVAMVSGWLEDWLKQEQASPVLMLAVMQASRKTEDRYRDLDDKYRVRVLDWLRKQQAPERYLQLVETGGELDAAMQGQIFGESLPAGLRML